ncbi:hypothetical protein [Sinomonas notoginsengisoli]|uniref:hypothetical protein n=1 Tax=Sinomonas notoginsengisoli TaxID=1457311 RepID=UPI001F272459|nr:hypothetical protein [Sinomonas notoginsengisoli]
MNVRFLPLRLLFGGVAAVLCFAAFAPPVLPVPAATLAGAAGGLLVGGLDVIVRDYAAFGRRAFQALEQRSGLAWPLGIATWLFCSIILLLLVPALIQPVNDEFVKYDQGPVLILAAAILALLPLLFRGCARVGSFFPGRHRALWAAFLVLVGAVLVTVQIALGAAVRIPLDWDAGMVLDTATALSRGEPFAPAERYYQWYPNNLMLTWVLWVYFSAIRSFGGTDPLLAAIVLHSIIMSASVLLVASVARRLAGYAAAVFFLVPSFLFVALGGWNSVPYSDTFGMFFPAAILWLVVAGRGHSLPARLGLWGVAAMVAAVGVQIKPTVLFSLMAAWAVTLLWKVEIRRRLIAEVVTVAISAAVLLGSAVAVQGALQDAGVVKVDLRSNTSQVPLTHFLKLGSTGRGSFQEDDIRETLGIKDPQERFQNGIDVYLERVQEMGPIGYAQQIVTKMTWSVGDGSFFAWGEGLARQRDNFTAEDISSATIRHYFTVQGEHTGIIRTLWQAGWLVVLLLVVAPLALRSRTLFSPAATMMRISLLALVVFLAVFENRSRYLYLYVPYFLLLASLTVASAAGMARSHRHLSGQRSGARVRD